MIKLVILVVLVLLLLRTGWTGAAPAEAPVEWPLIRMLPALLVLGAPLGLLSIVRAVVRRMDNGTNAALLGGFAALNVLVLAVSLSLPGGLLGGVCWLALVAVSFAFPLLIMRFALHLES